MEWLEKLSRVRRMIEAQGCDVMVVTALDEIAWLLNIRGRDIPYSPVIRAYAVITKTQLLLYVPPGKLSLAVKKHLKTDPCYSSLCARYDASIHKPLEDYHLSKSDIGLLQPLNYFYFANEK